MNVQMGGNALAQASFGEQMRVQAALTDPVSLLEEVYTRYVRLLQDCRKMILCDLADAPAAKQLAGYFERGKMIRPLLVFLATAAAGGDETKALPAAEALELLHGAALVHDDIVDQADERRGLPALHSRIGEAAALVVGDYLILRAFEVLARRAEGVNSVGLLKAVRLLSRYAQDCCRGQIQELKSPEFDCSEEQYYAMVRGKTASQFAAAASLGAIFGKAGDEDLRNLRRYAVNAGIAFQIRDDELDVTGDSAVLGKPAGNSIKAGRPLLPLIYLTKDGSSDGLAAYRAMAKDGLKRRDLVELLEREGALERVRQAEQRFLARALSALDGLRPSKARDALSAIATYSVYRDC
jgi:geranylgeranyl pyrophosphate synthase